MPFLSTGQTYAERFFEIAANDTAAQRQFLEKWERDQPNSGDLYMSQSAYYAQKASYETRERRTELGTRAIAAVDKGIAQYPDRLDLLTMKQTLAHSLNRFDISTTALLKANEYGNKMGHKWKEMGSKPLENGEAFFLQTVGDYINDILKKDDPALFLYLKQVSVAVLQYHPKHVMSLYGLALTHEHEKQNDKAKACYEKIVQYGNDQEKEFGRQRIAQLN